MSSAGLQVAGAATSMALTPPAVAAAAAGSTCCDHNADVDIATRASQGVEMTARLRRKKLFQRRNRCMTGWPLRRAATAAATASSSNDNGNRSKPRPTPPPQQW